jgi:hypothetical protein
VLANRGHLEAEIGQQLLSKGAIAFQTVAELASTDDGKAFFPQLRLKCTKADGFEQYEAFRPRFGHPGQFFLPIRRPWHETGHRPLRQLFADRHPYFVALGEKTLIEGPKIAGFGNAKNTHAISPIVAEPRCTDA